MLAMIAPEAAGGPGSVDQRGVLRLGVGRLAAEVLRHMDDAASGGACSLACACMHAGGQSVTPADERTHVCPHLAVPSVFGAWSLTMHLGGMQARPSTRCTSTAGTIPPSCQFCELWASRLTGARGRPTRCCM